MRYRLFVLCLLLVWLASGQQAPEPDAGTVTNNTFESKFFKFRYDFPQGWSTVNDDFRTTENRKRHEDQVQKALARDTANTTRTQVFWTYDLLIATPKLLAADDNPNVPHISVWARERFSTSDDPEDQVKMLAKFPNIRILHKPEKVILSGRKFIRADFVYYNDNFEALFVTALGKYLVGFDIRGNSEKEMNDLAQTMQTLKFL